MIADLLRILRNQAGRAASFPHPPAERKRDHHPDDEQEKRENQVGRRPAVPGGVTERRKTWLQLPGLLTSNIAATVRPRNASMERNRS